ncbi:hypothetical protein Taro_036118 [Colocasia esculenta]|uniref:Uncharacterized protein n=1 Tax=Colocasia esculenta TaxID=4460 RepID=A0A843W282_COLES|nr:hypothetical protein [Colocasia esculenta]
MMNVEQELLKAQKTSSATLEKLQHVESENWCDRILWYGKGLNDLSYVRGESRFSDLKPVYIIFTAEVESVNHQVKHMNCSSSRIEAEELLP